MIKKIQYTLSFKGGIATSLRHHITVKCDGVIDGKAVIEVTETDDGRFGDGTPDNPFIAQLVNLVDEPAPVSGLYDARGYRRDQSGHDYGSPRSIEISLD